MAAASGSASATTSASSLAGRCNPVVSRTAGIVKTQIAANTKAPTEKTATCTRWPMIHSHALVGQPSIFQTIKYLTFVVGIMHRLKALVHKQWLTYTKANTEVERRLHECQTVCSSILAEYELIAEVKSSKTIWDSPAASGGYFMNFLRSTGLDIRPSQRDPESDSRPPLGRSSVRNAGIFRFRLLRERMKRTRERRNSTKPPHGRALGTLAALAEGREKAKGEMHL